MKFLVITLVTCVFYCNGEEATVKEVTSKDAVVKDGAATDAVFTNTNANNTDVMKTVAANSTATKTTVLDNAAASAAGNSTPDAAGLDATTKNNVSTDDAPDAVSMGSTVLDVAPSIDPIASVTDSASASTPADGGASNDTDPVTNSTDGDQTKAVELINITYSSSTADACTDDLKVQGLTIASYDSKTVQDGDVVQESAGGTITSYDDGNITVTKFGDLQ